MAEPELSVVVCTHDRPDDLDRCLAALAAHASAAEVVVVDSASGEPCAAIVRRWRQALPALRFVRLDAPGLGIARNAGVAASCGEIVAFVDDDARVTRGWAQEITSVFRRSRVGVVGGACVADFAAPRPRWLSDRLLEFAGVTRFGGDTRLARLPLEQPFGANLALRRSAYTSVGGFANDLGRIGRNLLSGEDSDVVRRVADAGWEVWICPPARVLHRVAEARLQRRYYWRRLWWAGVTRAAPAYQRAPLLRMLAALPVRLALFVLTRDSVFLYRTAEVGGYITARARGFARIASRAA